MTDNNRKQHILLGCVADDFTGASDAASFLVKGGLRTALFNGIPRQEPELEDTEAVVVALKTRSCEAGEAVSESLRAFEWLKQKGAGLLYFKYCSTFDSTDLGNIGPVTDAVLEHYDIPYTLICPALPVNGRTVKDGLIYVNGILLENSPMRYHPITPMRRSAISELMKVQGKYPCICTGNIRNLQAKKPKNATAQHFYIVPDYETDEDGRLIAEAFADLDFVTGGSGLLEHLGRRLGKGSVTASENKDKAAGITQNGDLTLILAGSCSKATLGQVECFLNEGGKAIRITADEVMQGSPDAGQLWQQVSGMAGTKDCGSVLVYSSAPEAETAEARRRYGSRAAEKIETILAELGRLALEGGVRKIIVAGGETSGAVSKALGFEGFRIGESAAPGVPVMTPLTAEDVRLVLKSGNFGQESFFTDTAELLKECS